MMTSLYAICRPLGRTTGTRPEHDRPGDDEACRFRAMLARTSPADASLDAASDGDGGRFAAKALAEALEAAGKRVLGVALSAGTALPGAFETGSVKLRLTNGPLAGSEVEAWRNGEQLALRLRLAPRFAAMSAPDTRHRAAQLAAELSGRLGTSVTVECIDDPTA